LEAGIGIYRPDEPRGAQRGTEHHAADAASVGDTLSSCEALEFSPIDIDSVLFLDDTLQFALDELVLSQGWLPGATDAMSDGSSACRTAELSAGDLEPTRYLPGMYSLQRGSDSSLRLIRNWFEDVCPAWSAFDSGMNMNRKLAADLWHSSPAVFNALQSMSASFLSARLPQLREPALNLLKTATACIQAEVDSINNKPLLGDIPTGLIFSLFCLGTTICWLDASRLGGPFLRSAKSLLRRASLQYANAAEDKVEILAFFRKSMVYWEMLVSVVDDIELPSDMDDMILPGRLRRPAGDWSEASTDLLPHPWTGISSMTSRLFARSMRLCRAYRRRLTKPTGRAISLSTAMREIEEAQRLEEQLLELEFATIPQTNETGDWRTPRVHLAHVAEAYQLASLLQLYVTFPDLVSLRLPHESGSSREGDVPWDRWIIPLTLRLTTVLEKIPPHSGSRVIQPLLYICASTGLRSNLSYSNHNVSDYQSLKGAGPSSGSRGDNLDIWDYVGQLDVSATTRVTVGSVSSVALDIGVARNFIVRRLNALESTLQPKPIIVAEELVKAIWAAYDEEPPGCTAVHWLDVMEKKGLRSLFG
jgi:hypothetical protein